jgi:hypothetical protein
MRAALRFIALAVAFLLATRYVGWIGVPLIALAWGAGSGGDGWSAGAAATLAWTALLLRDAVLGPLGEVMLTLGAILHLPPVLLVAATLLLPAVLAASAAVVGGALLPRRRRAASGWGAMPPD